MGLVKDVASKVPVNWQLLANPVNWVIVWLMIAIGLAGIAVVSTSAGFTGNNNNG